MLKFTSESISFKTKAVWEKDKIGNFITTESSQKLPFSCPPAFGGIKTPSPEDLFLVSIATCTLTTLLHLCDSLHTKPEYLEVTTNSSISFNKSVGSFEFSEIQCTIITTGDKFLLERACALVPKYCLIGKSVKPKIEYKMKINGE